MYGLFSTNLFLSHVTVNIPMNGVLTTLDCYCNFNKIGTVGDFYGKQFSLYLYLLSYTLYNSPLLPVRRHSQYPNLYSHKLYYINITREISIASCHWG